jgi:hypothetical protein
MNLPLEKYRQIFTANFISQVEDKFYSSFCSELSLSLYVELERKNDRLKVTGVDLEGKDFSEYITFSFYFIDEYNKLESEARANIDKIILTYLDETKQEVFINNIIAELKVLHTTMSQSLVATKHEVYKSILLDKLTQFCSLLRAIYKRQCNETKSYTPKIQWLAETNVLTTLFYELLNGQKKTKKGASNTKPFIKAKTVDIERLLIENFLDLTGKPLSISTIKTYLNNSRPETRVGEGGRIELDI